MRRRARRVALLLAGLVALALLVAGVAVLRAPAGVSRTQSRVPVGAEPDGTAVDLDTTVFRPSGRGPFPAVLVAHGFGGSKADVTADALDLARHGFLALAWSARGAGASGGRIHLDAPGFEVRDAGVLLDVLAARGEVRRDGPGDPRVGVVGASYGGALALLLAGTDPRVDAVVPAITWNRLESALFPQAAGQGPGVFKRAWAGALFGAAAGGDDPACGRFDRAVCAAYAASARSGVPTPELAALMAASSPQSVLARVRAPALLVQGETDGLFPLGEGDANARGLAAAGTPVRVVWYAGGHDGGPEERDRLRSLTRDWLDGWLRHGRAPSGPGFAASEVQRAADAAADRVRVRTAPALPGVTAPAAAPALLPLSGPEQAVAAPPGGAPAAVTLLPGLGALGRLGGLPPPAGQTATFAGPRLDRPVRLTGAASVELRLRSSAPDAVLFAGLYDDPGNGGRPALLGRLVAPLRARVAAGGATVRVTLPAVVHEVEAGHRLAVSVSTTDAGYALPADARTYRVALAPGAALQLPVVATTAVPAARRTPLLAGGAVLLALLLAGGAGLVLRRRGAAGDAEDPDLAGVPLVLEGLEKTYANGYRAVQGLGFRVEAGQVLGLLGPNGAGKTTALRMVLGLLRPTAGSVRVFGRPVRPGAPVLSRVGAFVEGPGLLPHLTGRQNAALAWAATGRPAGQSSLETALEVAGLGDDLDRRVGTYSQGMRQRLAIAQAMLGLPELLVLDEPTNGLDPPQIREMREVLARYAATGRTVVVSSHLLSEVEQTCTHVVVMARGRLVRQGPVAELVGSATALVLDVDDPARALAVAAGVPGVHDLERTATGLTLRLVGGSRADLVRALVQAGVGVDRLAPQRGLEEVFLALVGEH